MNEKVRPCAVCGLFYPADEASLRKDVRALLRSAAGGTRGGTISGVISPHAGYMYSGATAATGYRQVQGLSYDTVVVISPSHHQFFEGVSVYPGSAYQTPLGIVRINAGLRERLAKQWDGILVSEAGHGEEHAIEVQLPFLQETLPEFSLLPLVVGSQKREYCFGLGEALASVLDRRTTLVVASTDLSHYYPAAAAERLDRVIIEDLGKFDEERLMDDLEGGTTEACGGGPVVSFMVALKRLGAKHLDVLSHCTSGDITGDNRSVVGYLSAVAYA